MAIVVENNGYKSFGDFGFFNLGIAVFVYLKKENRNKILLFKSIKSGNYKKSISWNFIRYIQKAAWKDLLVGGEELDSSVHSLKEIKQRMKTQGDLKLPVFNTDMKRVVGIAYNDHSQDVLLKHIELCIAHKETWHMFDGEICVDISQIGECNQAVYTLSKHWDIHVINSNEDWQYVDDSIEVNTINILPIIDDAHKYFGELVRRNELVDCLGISEELEAAGIPVFIFKVPSWEELKRYTVDEKCRHDNLITGFSKPDSSMKERQLQLVYGDDYELYRNNEIAQIVQYSRKDIIKLKDMQGPCCNVIDGKRVTVGNKGNNKKIHVYGPCIVGGAYVRDEDTIPSKMQQLINEENFPYDVINYGTCGYYRSYVNKILNSFIFGGDIVVIIDVFKNEWVANQHKQFISLQKAIEDRTQDIFFEVPCHLNRIGNESLTKEIINSIRGCLSKEAVDRTKISISKSNWSEYETKEINSDIRKWSEKCRMFPHMKEKTYGGIVMNCNPFTNGHLYLVKEALKFVDYLYVFIVEEDKSDFSFKDRYNMALAALSDMDNVIVLPSGRWVLSNETLPEYFRKSVDQEQIVCSSDDIELFAGEIAPIFHITIRFVGEEIADKVTRQYNEGMKRILPQYGMELIEIPRKMIDGQVISASVVREKLRKKEEKSILELVPESTYMYIKELKD